MWSMKQDEFKRSSRGFSLSLGMDLPLIEVGKPVGVAGEWWSGTGFETG